MPNTISWCKFNARCLRDGWFCWARQKQEPREQHIWCMTSTAGRNSECLMSYGELDSTARGMWRHPTTPHPVSSRGGAVEKEAWGESNGTRESGGLHRYTDY